MRPTRLLLLTAVATLFVPACGEDRKDPVGGATSDAKPVATIEVEETEYRLDPRDPAVAEAGVVEISVTNAGEIAHALEVEGPGGEVETEEIAPGDTATLEADLGEPGSYKWYCPISDHEERGMVGKIAVGVGAADAEKKLREEDEGEAGPGSDGPGGY